MTKRMTALLSGLFFLCACGIAQAHQPVPHHAYPDGNWSGGVVVWGDSRGRTNWSGTLNYAYDAAYGYAPGYIPWAAPHRHGPQCRQWPGHGYAKAYREGYRDGRHHSRGRSHKHGHRH